MVVYLEEQKHGVLTEGQKNIEKPEFSDSFEDFVCSNFSAGELFELIQTKKTCKEVLDELNELFIEELKNEEEDEEDDEEDED